MNIDERIARLEEKIPSILKGTIIQRCLKPGDGAGIHWSIAIGVMTEPKLFFYGDTIHEALLEAEEALL